MMRLRFTQPALADLEAISSHIRLDSTTAADRVINRIEDLCNLLTHSPGLGRPSEFPGARKLPVPGLRYKIIYEVNDAASEVIILRVYHGARNLP